MKSPKTHLERPFVRYLVVGGSLYIVELGIIVAGQAAGLSALAAVGLAFWSGLGISFVLQKLVTFDDKRLAHKLVAKQFTVYAALVLWNFVFTIAVTKLLSPIIPAVVTRTIAIAITTLWNFYLYKTSIFKSDNNPVY